MIKACVLNYSSRVSSNSKSLIACVSNCIWRDFLSLSLVLVFHHLTCKILLAMYRIENAQLTRNRFPKHFALQADLA